MRSPTGSPARSSTPAAAQANTPCSSPPGATGSPASTSWTRRSGGPRAKAAERGLAAEFLVKDALTLGEWGERFTSVIDSGLFHVFSDDDRRRYVQGLARVLVPSGRLFLMCFSDEEPGQEGPRRVSRQEFYDTFADGWEVESVQPSQFDINSEFTEVKFSEGGPKAWFAVVRRKG